MIDGHLQRRALTAAGQALTALEAGDPVAARRAAAEAASLDQVGAFSGFVAAIDIAAARLDTGEPVGDSAWAGVARSLEVGPLRSQAEAHRGGAAGS